MEPHQSVDRNDDDDDIENDIMTMFQRQSSVLQYPPKDHSEHEYTLTLFKSVVRVGCHPFIHACLYTVQTCRNIVRIYIFIYTHIYLYMVISWKIHLRKIMSLKQQEWLSNPLCFFILRNQGFSSWCVCVCVSWPSETISIRENRLQKMPTLLASYLHLAQCYQKDFPAGPMI